MKEITRKIRLAYEDIEDIHKLTKGETSVSIKDYFHQLTGKILLFETAKDIRDLDIDELVKQNKLVYGELDARNYHNSYANPRLCQKNFGDVGTIMAAIYYEAHKVFDYMLQGQLKLVKAHLEFIKIMYDLMNEDEASQLEKVFYELKHRIHGLEIEYSVTSTFNMNTRFYESILENRTPSLAYLYFYGKYISENEIKLASKFNNMCEEKLELLATRIVESYIKGFKIDNKDISKRSIVCINGMIGQEKLIGYILVALKNHDLIGKITEMSSTPVNRQLDFDHKFDKSIYFDDLYLEEYLEITEKVMNATANMMDISGFLLVESFGENHVDLSCDTFLKLSEKQISLESKWKMKKQLLEDRFIPETETSFCIVAFPCPEIHENFDEIFDEIVNINMLDSEAHEIIQQRMIDVLDEADYVWIKGSRNNKTNLKVKMYDLEDVSKASNFLNCGADVNIPVGEVFTTPVLKGTTGILHVNDILLEDYRYKELELHFTDGFIKDYNCGNYDESDKNMTFIQENLLFPHKTLPMSEFAIGTNTLAYVMAEKYGIVDKLPILIVEKMGPHFAIGDTCYSWREETPIYSQIDGREIVAKDNEFSIKRKESLETAYTNKHIDITIPYDDIEFIKVVKKSGETIDIITNGRFSLEGTTVLNAPFDGR